MESKKINQLATNVAPVSSDLTIIGDPTTGVSKKVTLSQIASLFAGAVDFYANLAAFPASGTLNTIYCAKDTLKLYLWSGSAYVEIFPSQAVLNTYQLLSAKGVANGYASLDASGKVPIGELPSSIMEYKGLWSAATNTPTLANGTGDTGDVYICSAAGSVNFGAGAITFAVGDYVIYSGTIWQRSSGAVGTVTSVGLSSATSGVTIGSSPITTSGTITLAIATATTSQNGLLSSTDWATFNAKQNAITLTTTGTSGASTLVGATLNIPNYGSALTGYVPYTGATQDVDLGAFKLNAQSLHIKGTGGLGHLGLKHQSASATASANEVSLFADSLGDLSWLNGNLYLSKFITSGNTAARSYTFPNATCNIPNDSLVVHLASTETITGAKTFSGYTTFTSTVDITSGLTFSNSGFTLVLQPPTLSVNRTVTLPNGTGTLALTSDISYPVTSVFGRTGAVVATSGDYTTAQVTESGNLYFTDSRARLAISLTTTGTSGASTYNNTTGVLNIPQYTDQFVGTVTSVAALTIGTSGTDLSSTVATSTTTPVITLNVPTASAANRGALSSADWTTFNNKQSALTNPVTGTGTTNYLPKFTGASTIGNSLVFDNGTSVVIGTATPATNYILTLRTQSADYTKVLDWGTAAGGSWGNMTINISAPYQTILNSGAWQFNISGTQKMLLDNTGNLGLGVTPSAWARGKALEIGTIGNAIWGDVSNEITTITSNAYLNTTDLTTGWAYGITAASARYDLIAGVHKWFNAPSGTAGNAITFTQAMTLFSTGNLSIANTTDSGYKLDVNGTGRFSGKLTISNTSDVYSEMTTSSVDGDNFFGFSNTGDGNSSWGIGRRNTGEFWIANYTGNFLSGTRTTPLVIASTGAATFSSSVTAGGNIQTDGTANKYIKSTGFISNQTGQLADFGAADSGFFIVSGGAMNLVAAGATRLTIASTGAATFNATSNTGDALTVSATGGNYIKMGGIASSTSYIYSFETAFNIGNSYSEGSLRLFAGNSAKLTIASTGAATFSSSVTATQFASLSASGGGAIFLKDSSAVNKWEIGHSSNALYFYNYTSATNPLVLSGATGAATFSSSVTATGFFESSDSRLKTLIQDNYQTKGIASITPKLYTKNGKVELGYYAQDFVGILDSAVSKGSDDMLSLSYREVLVAKVYALEQRIKELENK